MYSIFTELCAISWNSNLDSSLQRERRTRTTVEPSGVQGAGVCSWFVCRTHATPRARSRSPALGAHHTPRRSSSRERAHAPIESLSPSLSPSTLGRTAASARRSPAHPRIDSIPSLIVSLLLSFSPRPSALASPRPAPRFICSLRSSVALFLTLHTDSVCTLQSTCNALLNYAHQQYMYCTVLVCASHSRTCRDLSLSHLLPLPRCANVLHWPVILIFIIVSLTPLYSFIVHSKTRQHARPAGCILHSKS